MGEENTLDLIKMTLDGTVVRGQTVCLGGIMERLTRRRRLPRTNGAKLTVSYLTSSRKSTGSAKGRLEKAPWFPNIDAIQFDADLTPGSVPGFFYALESFLRNAKFSSIERSCIRAAPASKL
jgi:hypothetical protein